MAFSASRATRRATDVPQDWVLKAPLFVRGAFSLGLTSTNSEIASSRSRGSHRRKGKHLRLTTSPTRTGCWRPARPARWRPTETARSRPRRHARWPSSEGQRVDSDHQSVPRGDVPTAIGAQRPAQRNGRVVGVSSRRDKRAQCAGPTVGDLRFLCRFRDAGDLPLTYPF